MIFGCLIWTGAYGLDFAFIHDDWHRIFISIVHLGVTLACTGAVLTGIEFTQNKHLLNKTMWLLLILQPLLILTFAIVDPLFHTLLSDTYIATIQNRVQWVQQVAFLTTAVEFGGSAIWSIFILKLLVGSIRHSAYPVRYRFYLLIIPYILVWAVAVSHQLGFRPVPGLNLTPVSLSFHALWIFFSIGYYKMYDLVPLVRSEIVDELDEPVVILDGNDRVVDWNIAAEQLFVHGRRYLALTTTDHFFVAYPEISQKIKLLPEKRVHSQWSWLSTTPLKKWEIKAKRIWDRNRYNMGLVMVFHDVTEQRQLEKRMIEANHILQLGNATKDRFLSIISHDLRGPLTGIKALLRILNEKVTTRDKEISEMTQSLVDATESIFSLLENLLEWSKLQRGQEEFFPKNYSLEALVTEAVQLFELNAKNKNLKLIVRVPTHAFVYCDDRMIFIVLRNLISNAIKFSFRETDIILEAKDIGKNWELVVKDTGVGMSPETLAKLFQVGEVVKSIGTGGENGNGVGLLLCKEFIDMNGGLISASSDGTTGSTFTISLPKPSKGTFNSTY
jgi:signal transduction histidine kinase